MPPSHDQYILLLVSLASPSDSTVPASVLRLSKCSCNAVNAIAADRHADPGR